MGLIKAAIGAVGGTLADQWKEFIYCDSLSADTLLVRGQKRVGKRSSNTKGNDNIITQGSKIAVAAGQCMIIVEQGKVVDVCAEPGEYVFDASSEPSIFTGDLGESVRKTLATMDERLSFGGDTGKDQRVYFINLKEMMDNKFGTPTPIPFRVVDTNIGLDLDVSVRASGVYSYKIVDPLLFFSSVSGNVKGAFTRDEIDGQLKTEFVSALQPAFGRLSDLGLRPNQIPQHTTELENAMNQALSGKWSELRGLKIISVALGSVTLPPEDQEMIKKTQQAAILRDPTMAAATLAGAQADAMRTAAGNSAGAMTGFMGMNMAMNAGGMNAQNLYSMGQQQAMQQQQMMQQPQQPIQPAQNTQQGGWQCSCGTVATGNFCPNCGSPKPQPSSWQCSCGTVNQGNFCQNCGAKRP